MQKKIILIKALSSNINTLILYHLFVKNLFVKFNIQSNLTFFKKKKKKITFFTFAHVHKKAKEQFQLINFSYQISFSVPEIKTTEIICLLKLNGPKNINLNFTLSSKKYAT